MGARLGGGARQNTHTNTQHVRALTAPVPLHNPCGPLPRMDGQASGGVVEGRAPCSLSPGARPAWREGVPPPARAGRVQGAYSPPRAPLLPRSLPCAHTWPERERACTCAGGRGPLSLKKKKKTQLETSISRWLPGRRPRPGGHPRRRGRRWPKSIGVGGGVRWWWALFYVRRLHGGVDFNARAVVM